MKLLVFSISAVVLLTGGAWSRAAEPLDGIAAIVNNDVVTFAELRKVTADAEAKAGRELSGESLRVEITKIRRKAIHDLIERKRNEKVK